MKKIITLFLVIVTCVSVFACGNSNPVPTTTNTTATTVATTVNIVETTAVKSNMVLAVEEAIAMIGTVDYDSLDEIENAEKLYNYLTDNEKEHVANRLELFSARETYDNLPPRRPEFQDDEILALYAMDKMINGYLLGSLKNPDSLIINGLTGGLYKGETYIFKLDYTAQNSFGGSVRQNLYIAVERHEKSFSTITWSSSTFYGDYNQEFAEMFFREIMSVKNYDVNLLYDYILP